jgi:hypothetical protein
LLLSYPRRNFYLCIAAAMLLLPSPALPWGDRGHEITGVVAYARLTFTAKKNVDALLAADRDALTGGDFVSRTTWADEYRDSDRQTTRRHYEQTRNWHFVNIDIKTGRISGCNRKLPAGTPASAGPANACIIDKVEQFAAELRDRSTPARERLLALKFLLHLVGDLHHPLHTADNGDRGGNDIAAIFASPPQRENLHFYWDNYLVHQLGSDSRAVATLTGPTDQRGAGGFMGEGSPVRLGQRDFPGGKNGCLRLHRSQRHRKQWRRGAHRSRIRAPGDCNSQGAALKSGRSPGRSVEQRLQVSGTLCQ